MKYVESPINNEKSQGWANGKQASRASICIESRVTRPISLFHILSANFLDFEWLISKMVLVLFQAWKTGLRGTVFLMIGNALLPNGAASY